MPDILLMPHSLAARTLELDSTIEQRSRLHIVLISMPFMEHDRPSIQIGLLKAIADHHGFSVKTLHANLDFAARIGPDYYRALCEHRGPMIGEWLFSLEAFGDEAPDPDSTILWDLAGEISYLGG